MASLSGFITQIIAALDETEVPYIVTGSFASIVYSEPRTTQDIDFVVRTSLAELEPFVTKVKGLGFYVPQLSADVDMFNVLDTESQWKADIILFPDEPFEVERFARRVSVELLPDLYAYIPTVEDMILTKLRWIKGRESALQVRDIESMIEINGGSLDRDYLADWATKLGVSERLSQMLRPTNP